MSGADEITFIDDLPDATSDLAGLRAFDSNGDGKLTFGDTRLVARAVEIVEQEHPDLIGGMGLYNRGSASYVHIDARGTRARWRG
jgi:hypothetical protein